MATSHKLQSKWEGKASLTQWLQKDHYTDLLDRCLQMFVSNSEVTGIHLPFRRLSVFVFVFITKNTLKLAEGQCSEKMQGKGTFTDVQGSVCIAWTWNKMTCPRITSLGPFREVSYDRYKCGRKLCLFPFSQESSMTLKSIRGKPHLNLCYGVLLRTPICAPKPKDFV